MDSCAEFEKVLKILKVNPFLRQALIDALAWAKGHIKSTLPVGQFRELEERLARLEAKAY